MQTECPCGSGASYDECCGPLHTGVTVASTAEQLMRSRYSAFVLNDDNYLLRTWHPAKRPDLIELDRGIEWRRLQIRHTDAGTASDETGTVEFIAHYWDSEDQEYGRHQEISRFVRQKGRWLYVEPVEPVDVQT
jgi:SEC-C motif-containing protein